MKAKGKKAKSRTTREMLIEAQKKLACLTRKNKQLSKQLSDILDGRLEAERHLESERMRSAAWEAEAKKLTAVAVRDEFGGPDARHKRD